MAARFLHVVLAVAVTTGLHSAGYRSDADYVTENNTVAEVNGTSDAQEDSMASYPLKDLSTGQANESDAWYEDLEYGQEAFNESVEPNKVFMSTTPAPVLVTDTTASPTDTTVSPEDATPQPKSGLAASGDDAKPVPELSDTVGKNNYNANTSSVKDNPLFDEMGDTTPSPSTSGAPASSGEKPTPDSIQTNGSADPVPQDTSVPEGAPLGGSDDSDHPNGLTDGATARNPGFHHPRLVNRVRGFNKGRAATSVPVGRGLDEVVAGVLDPHDPYGSFSAGYRHGSCRAKVASLIEVGQRTRTVKVS
jgi:hypothetical protein